MDFKFPLPNIKNIAESYYDTYIDWLTSFVNKEIHDYESVYRLFPKEGWETAKLLNSCKQEREWLKVAYKKVKLKWREHHVEKIRKYTKKKNSTRVSKSTRKSTEHATVCTNTIVSD